MSAEAALREVLAAFRDLDSMFIDLKSVLNAWRGPTNGMPYTFWTAQEKRVYRALVMGDQVVAGEAVSGERVPATDSREIVMAAAQAFGMRRLEIMNPWMSELDYTDGFKAGVAWERARQQREQEEHHAPG